MGGPPRSCSPSCVVRSTMRPPHEDPHCGTFVTARAQLQVGFNLRYGGTPARRLWGGTPHRRGRHAVRCAQIRVQYSAARMRTAPCIRGPSEEFIPSAHQKSAMCGRTHRGTGSDIVLNTARQELQGGHPRRPPCSSDVHNADRSWGCPRQRTRAHRRPVAPRLPSRHKPLKTSASMTKHTDFVDYTAAERRQHLYNEPGPLRYPTRCEPPPGQCT
jgi:hypothetical protein